MSALTAADVLDDGGLLSRALPGYEPRPGQVLMAQAVEALLREPAGGSLKADAGVGVGKTFAYVVPVLLAGRKTTVSTSSKALQDQLALKDLPFLAAHLGPALGRPITWATVKGRANYLCLKALDDLERDDVGRRALFVTPAAAADFERLRAWHVQTEDGDLERVDGPPFDPGLVGQVTVGEDECVGRVCPFYEACWTTLARERARVADVTVTNHYLLFLDAQLKFATGGKAALLPDDPVLVGDEAHEWAAVARATLGETFSFTYGLTLARRLPRLPYGDPGHGAQALDLARPLALWAQDADERLAALAEQGDQGRQLLLGDERRFAGPVAAAARALAGTCKRMHDELEQEALASAVRGHRAMGEDPAEPTLAEAAVWARQADALERHAAVAMALATPLGEKPGEDPDAFVRLIERDGHGARARLVGRYIPVDVSTALKLYVWGRPPGAPARHVVATSATLATAWRGPGRFALFCRETGAPSGATAGHQGPDAPPVYEVVVPSPFNYRRNGRLFVPPPGAISADRQRDSARYHDQLAEQELALLHASGGRAFLLFTSRASLRAVYERLAPRLPGRWRVFVQGEHSRQEVLAAFRDEAGANEAPPVLFATRSYFEGIDVPGSGLSLVVLDKLPFPAPDEPLYAARARQVGRLNGDPNWGHWRTLTIPLVIQLVKQAAGRLIRSQSDVGCMAVLDTRLIERAYGREMRTALPSMPLVRSVAEVGAFFRAQPAPVARRG